MAQAPFVQQPDLTAIALTYRNLTLIADQVLPRVPVLSQQFKWSKYTLADGYTIPDTRVGRKSAPNQIDWTASEVQDATKDYGLDDPVPIADIQSAQAANATQGEMPIDPLGRSTMLLTDLVALDRENRVASLVFNLATYPAANKTTLSGTTQWSDFVNSDPLQALTQALDIPIMRPNVMVIGQAAWTKLRTHPKITAAVYASGGNATGGGTVVARQALADLLEIEEVIVGSGFVNTAKPGQAANMLRVWGKHCALIYRPTNIMSTEKQVVFGFTAQWGDKIAGTIDDNPYIGLRGGILVRVGESVQEVIAANDVAYYFQNAVA